MHYVIQAIFRVSVETCDDYLSAGVFYYILKRTSSSLNRESASWPGLSGRIRRQWSQRNSKSIAAPPAESQKGEEEGEEERRKITSTVWRTMRRMTTMMKRRRRRRTARTNLRDEGQRRRKWLRLVCRGEGGSFSYPLYLLCYSMCQFYNVIVRVSLKSGAFIL